MAIDVMTKRHFQPNEDFSKMCTRVSDAIAKDGHHSDVYWAMMMKGLFFPSSPYLANAGLSNNNMSCFVIPIEDSIDGIFDTLKKSAKIQSCYGGVGIDFSPLRPKGAKVKSMARGGASGPVAFMELFNTSASCIYQGGARSGAMMAVLRVDHPDIREFIHCKDVDGKLGNFNVSVAITDKFMEAALDEENDNYGCSNGDVIHAKELWDEICQHAHQTGEPGIIFIDEINKYNVNLQRCGAIAATNPCSEASLLPNEACNLGSIVVSRMLTKDNEIDWDLLKRTVEYAIEFLDDAYDVNVYPLPEIKDQSLKTRKLGLGIMGFADMLIKMGVRYGSEDSFGVAEELMSYINKIAHEASCELEAAHDPFRAPELLGNRFIDNKKDRRRNSACTSIAPNGTISLIAGVNGGIEPLFALAYNRLVNEVDGSQTKHYVINESVDAVLRLSGKNYGRVLKSITDNNGKIVPEFNYTQDDVEYTVIDNLGYLVTSSEVSVEDHIKMQSVFQRYVDMGISKTINLPNTATVEDVKEAYGLSYECKCKGVTVYRDGSRDKQVLSTDKPTDNVVLEDSDKSELPAPMVKIPGSTLSWAYKKKDERPRVLAGKTYSIRTSNGKYYLTINGEDSKPMEIFASPHSSDVEGNVDAEGLCRIISLALRSGVPVHVINDQLEKVRCQSLLSLPHNIKKCLEDFVFDLQPQSIAKVKSLSECPECHELQVVEECGCAACKSCGWSKCG
jgi:ribonucleoside-diphosphate reductase alpha chain